ncbi:MAG: bifunctional phosphoribosyl-AMP cyclohydrolase/phosphoribosyl-ATP diphosphatase HisIE [Nitrospirae bacterium]|nr:MAG: bifunctional phosphoribosyl-AMP cyclohydrolase/phosphoribosyl-ATP diphosphatase HisIE [Nitrospirota bacterium]
MSGERRLPASCDLRFDNQGLIPCIVQDWLDGTVLMLGYMNREALETTVRTQLVHFWSRSRQRLWKKGETSGHELRVKAISVDCDRDAIVIRADPCGPTCHTGHRSCFFTELVDGEWREPASSVTGGIIERLYDIVLERKREARTDSYVALLCRDGRDRVLKKVVEEAGEVVLAAKNDHRHELVHEVADLWFHTLVLLGVCEIPPYDVYEELKRRFGTSGLRQKEARA